MWQQILAIGRMQGEGDAPSRKWTITWDYATWFDRVRWDKPHQNEEEASTGLFPVMIHDAYTVNLHPFEWIWRSKHFASQE